MAAPSLSRRDAHAIIDAYEEISRSAAATSLEDYHAVVRTVDSLDHVWGDEVAAYLSASDPEDQHLDRRMREARQRVCEHLLVAARDQRLVLAALEAARASGDGCVEDEEILELFSVTGVRSWLSGETRVLLDHHRLHGETGEWLVRYVLRAPRFVRRHLEADGRIAVSTCDEDADDSVVLTAYVLWEPGPLSESRYAHFPAVLDDARKV